LVGECLLWDSYSSEVQVVARDHGCTSKPLLDETYSCDGVDEDCNGEDEVVSRSPRDIE